MTTNRAAAVPDALGAREASGANAGEPARMVLRVAALRESSR